MKLVNDSKHAVALFVIRQCAFACDSSDALPGTREETEETTWFHVDSSSKDDAGKLTSVAIAVYRFLSAECLYKQQPSVHYPAYSSPQLFCSCRAFVQPPWTAEFKFRTHKSRHVRCYVYLSSSPKVVYEKPPELSCNKFLVGQQSFTRWVRQFNYSLFQRHRQLIALLLSL